MKLSDKDLKKVEILYHDNHLVIALKLANELTQPVNPSDDSLEKKVKTWIKTTYDKKGDVFCHVVHRLDKPVSGIVLFAKTSKALSRLNLMLRNQEFIKVYVAEVEGIVKNDTSTLKNYLKHSDHQAIVYAKMQPEAQEAILTYQVLERKEKTTVLAVLLKTGRYHQIRAQLSYFGHPIVGDVKYGAKKTLEDRVKLHHAYLEFDHPVTKERMKILCPPDFFPSFTGWQ